MHPSADAGNRSGLAGCSRVALVSSREAAWGEEHPVAHRPCSGCSLRSQGLAGPPSSWLLWQQPLGKLPGSRRIKAEGLDDRGWGWSIGTILTGPFFIRSPLDSCPGSDRQQSPNPPLAKEPGSCPSRWASSPPPKSSYNVLIAGAHLAKPSLIPWPG